MESELIRAVDNIANNIDALAQPRLIDWLAVLISVLSVLLSAAAICFAVKVADKQNKIMLFEKRYEIYNIFCKCIIFARMLENLHTSKDIIDGYKMLFFDKCLPENRTGNNVINEQRIAMIRKVEVCFYLLPSLDQENLISIFRQLDNLMEACLLDIDTADLRKMIKSYSNIVKANSQSLLASFDIYLLMK
ncbi:hypothetical protein [Flavonifractor sp. An4]|uniref:hypothetical protein n=1 Tax=Flavonifractor sp. An4 TaxID=1965634 RepID=UPI000B3A13F6|nr:hypothetical protein [Flavonifractor sp. An4]OUO17172.1 hypothetical protein B5F94_04140 [Flavonifractor sp. An4]